MIAKRIPREKAASDFARLTRYVVDAQGRIDPASWTRTADYILDTAHGGAKVSGVRVTNCSTDDPAAATFEIMATQARNTRSSADKSYHLVVSFPPGERPTPEQLADIEAWLCAAIGLAEHQRISAVHRDTDHFHVHVAINKVHPRTFRNMEPYFDHLKLMKACEQLEIRHGLTRTNHGEAVARGVNGRAADMEAHAGRESLERWIAENARAELVSAAKRASDWQGFHAALAEFDLEIRPRGAGLVISTRRGGVSVRASQVARELAASALARRWGSYEPPGPEAWARTPRQAYTGAPRHAHPRTTELFAQYQAARQAALAARGKGLRDARAEFGKYRRDLDAWSRERRAILRESRSLSRFEKRAASRALTAQRRADLEQIRERAAKRRATVVTAHPLPTWQGFLQVRAAAGDLEALAVLRSRERRGRAAGEDSVQGEHPARDVVVQAIRPTARRDGGLVYHVADGGVVTDLRNRVRVDAVSSGAVSMALALAWERFEGRPLAVRGSTEFQQQVAAAAAARGIAIQLANPELVRERDTTRTAHRGRGR